MRCKQWDNIVNACQEASEEVLGYKEKSDKRSDDVIKRLSEQQKKLRVQINATQDKEKRGQLQQKRNKLMREIRNRKESVEKAKIIQDLEEIEKCKDDSTKMFKAVKHTHRKKPEQTILVENGNGSLTSQEEEAVEIVTDILKTCSLANVKLK